MQFTSQHLLVFGFAATVLLSLFIGAWSRRGKTKTLLGFFWGDNSFSVRQGVHLNVSTSFAINGVLYSAWLGYLAGWVSLLPQVVWCAGFLFLSRYADKLALLSRTGTLHGNIGYVFGKASAYWAAIASLIGFTLLFGWELYIGAGIFKTVLPNNSVDIENVVYFSMAGVGALYCMLGGLRGNLKANIFQNILAGIALLVAIIYLGFIAEGTQHFSWGDFTETHTFSALATELTIAGIISNFVLFMVYQFLDMSVWQNIASLTAKKKAARKSLISSAFWIFLFPGVSGSALGMTMRSYDGITADNIIPNMLQQVSTEPFIFTILIMGFFAMMLSTIDGLLLAACQSATWDITDREKVLRIITARGSSALTKADIINLEAFSTALRNPSNDVSLRLYEKLSDTGRQVLTLSGEELDKNADLLIEEINIILSSNDFFSKTRFQNVYLSSETLELITVQEPDGDFMLLNRFLLEDAYPKEIVYGRHSHIMRKEQAYKKTRWKIDSKLISDMEAKVLDHTNYALLVIAIAGGLITLFLVRSFEVTSFNLIYIAYVAQMALFPAIWSILHGRNDPHPRSALAIAVGLIGGYGSTILGLYGIAWAGTWAPVIALALACIIHWPFARQKTI